MGKWVAIVTFALLLGVGAFAYYDLNIAKESMIVPAESAPVSLDAYLPKQISVVRAHQDGENRFTGHFTLPHSCYGLDESAAYLEGKIFFTFTVEDETGKRSPCLQIPSRKSFLLLVEAPKDAPAEFRVNGKLIPATIKETSWESAAGVMIDTSYNP